MEVGGDEPIAAGDGHLRIVQGRHQRADHVTADGAGRIEDDDDRADRAAQRRLQRVTGAEGLDGAHQLIARAGHVHRARSHDHDLCAVHQPRGQPGEHLIHRSLAGGDEHRAGSQGGGLLEARGHRLDHTVVGHAALDEVVRAGWLKVECESLIDHPPASALDARLELVGPLPIALDACPRAFLGERYDLGWG